MRGKSSDYSQYYRKAPSGEYVVILPMKFKDIIVEKFKNKITIEVYGDELIVKTRSRSIIKLLVKLLEET